MEQEKGRVCVTGGTGFLASWLVMRLLENGYSVNTTIRPDPKRQRDISFLTNLPGAAEKLKIFEADLSDPNSFYDAIQGCVGVFLMATTMDFYNKEPEQVVTKRVVVGTLGILKACVETKTVERVVYTSSAAAVVYNGKDIEEMDESYWSDADYIRGQEIFGGNYAISKTTTEKKVLEFAEEHGLDLVTVNPSYVNGPFICPILPGSVLVSLSLMFGVRDLHGILIKAPMVHVDDVARAHIFVFENPEAKGRYICSSITVTLPELANFLSSKYSEFAIPTLESLKDVQGMKLPRLLPKKLTDLGFAFKYGIEEMYGEAIRCCKEKGYLQINTETEK